MATDARGSGRKGCGWSEEREDEHWRRAGDLQSIVAQLEARRRDRAGKVRIEELLPLFGPRREV